MVSRLVCLVMAVLLSMAPAAAHPPSIANDAEARAARDEVEAFRKTIVDAIKAKDVAKLRNLYAPAFVHTHTSGKTDGRDARIVTLLTGDPVIETAPVQDLEIRIPTGWTGIATGVSPIMSLADGKTYLVRWTVTYVRGDRSWQIAASHATRMGEVK